MSPVSLLDAVIGLEANALELSLELADPALQGHDLIAQAEDATDPFEVHALLLGESLNLQEQGNVSLGVAPSAAGRTTRLDDAQPVVRTQRLGVHSGEVGRYRDDVDRGVI